ncbi:tetratricopeptide repeat protein [Rubrimonas cliftonensis]|uniref:Tetratricopeptide repeat-containing protein n=1 Tax=Rubrimonas cliftonensis TaxID=89524 RepID=A0A1H3VFJ6_9RHOB|nr:tetratricopeptide repeat protein [Rubrimonas cliftonensis]SDZ72912.1 Tetratricopeptide repeat-containing protein [Rubrimonas cliftonensis]
MSAFQRTIFAAAAFALALAAAPSGAATIVDRLDRQADEAQEGYLVPIAEALAAGDIDRAETLIQARLEAEPDDALAWELLGVASALSGDAAGADAAYARAIALDPGRLTAWIKRGDLADAYGDMEGARRAWLGALDVNPRYAIAHERLGFYYATAGRPDAAISHLEQALAASAADGDRLEADLAFLYNRADRPKDALTLLKRWDEAAARGDAAPSLQMLALGNAHFALGDAETAIARYRLGLATAPGDGALLRAFGAALLATGDAEGAAAALEGPAAAEPIDAFANAQRGRALLAIGRPAEAVDAAERAIEAENGASAATLMLAARARLAAGEADAAADAARRLVALHPDEPAAWREQSTILGALGRYDAALAASDAGLARFPEDAAMLRGRSLANLRLGRLDAAAADAAGAAAVAPDWLEPRYLLGVIEEARGDAVAAEAAYRAALAVAPDHALSLNNLAMLRLRAGAAEEALPLAQRSVSLAGVAATYDTLAQVLAASDRLGEALGAQREAVRLDANDIGARLRLATYVAASGDVEAARAVLREALAAATVEEDVERVSSALDRL